MREPFPPVPPTVFSGDATDPFNMSLADTWVEFTERPTVVGEYLDGRNQLNVSVPFRGQDLIEIKLGVMLPVTAEADMAARKAEFEAHQNFSLKNPVKWWTVGYWIDPVTFELYAYHQYQFPSYTPPQPIWSNWPDEPPIWVAPA